MRIGVNLQIDGVKQAFAVAPKVMERNLDRFLSRAAEEVAREERIQAPKAFSTLTNAIRVEQAGFLHWRSVAGTNYAEQVKSGRPAGKMPGTSNGLMEWVKLRTRLQGKELDRATFAIARAIGMRGIKPNPFDTRTMEKMESRVMQLVRQGAINGVMEVFG